MAKTITISIGERAVGSVSFTSRSIGSITLTDVTATAQAYSLSASSGTITLNGQAANLEYHRVMSASSGAITLTGGSANLLYNRLISASAGSITLTGQAASLKYNRVLSAGAGTLTLTGQSATLTYTTGYDSDAQTFIDAANAITSLSTTQEEAIDLLVTRLKGTGTTNGSNLWSNAGIVEIFPFVGTTNASVHALGLLRNEDISSWANTPTFADTGVTLNGTSQYGVTGITPSTDLTANDVTMFAYCKNNVNGNEVAIGSENSSNQRLVFWPRVGGNLRMDRYDSASAGGSLRFSNSDSSGFTIVTSRSSTDSEGYLNGSSLGTETDNGGSQPTYDLYIGARNNAGTADAFMGNELRLIGICTNSSGLSDNEAQDLTDAVEDYQDYLSRGVVA